MFIKPGVRGKVDPPPVQEQVGDANVKLARRKTFLPFLLIVVCQAARSQENPYFVTDHHHLEEAGTLGMAYYSVLGNPRQANSFLGSQMEFEYRLRKWWATEIQLKGQTTSNDSTIFTGYTWVNKFKLYRTNRFINPALTLEWEDASAADKSIAEIEGHGGEEALNLRNDIARRIHEHEIEARLILSRDHKGWNFAGNITLVKNLSAEPWQFGYSLATSRPLSTADSQQRCALCRRSLSAGLEFYGGLGDAHSFGLQNTAHYLGPEMSWQLSERLAVKVGPHFGLTRESEHALVHFGVVYDIPHFGRHVRELFHGE